MWCSCADDSACGYHLRVLFLLFLSSLVWKLCALQRELSSLVTRAVTEKEEAGGRIVALMDSLELSRGEQARLLEHKQTELDVSAWGGVVLCRPADTLLLIFRDSWQAWTAPRGSTRRTRRI